jgi:hypothetical protein
MSAAEEAMNNIMKHFPMREVRMVQLNPIHETVSPVYAQGRVIDVATTDNGVTITVYDLVPAMLPPGAPQGQGPSIEKKLLKGFSHIHSFEINDLESSAVN